MNTGSKTIDPDDPDYPPMTTAELDEWESIGSPVRGLNDQQMTWVRANFSEADFRRIEQLNRQQRRANRKRR